MSPILVFIGKECGKELVRAAICMAAPKIILMTKDAITSICYKNKESSAAKDDPYLVSE